MTRPSVENTHPLLTDISAADLLPPKRLTVSITSFCNLQCDHCWVECPQIGDNAERVALQPLQQLVAEFIDLGVEELCITGGEPLTHPDWLEILSFCCEPPQLKSVILQTNATLIDADVVKALTADTFQKLSFQVSLDGCSETTHDPIRGPGSLKMALHGLKCLVEAGFGAKITIAFTEMRHNFEEIPQLLELADHLDISSVVGLPLINSGCAEQSETSLLPTEQQYCALLDRLASDALFRERYERLGSFSAIEWQRGKSRSVHSGCRFLEKPYVTVTGLLFPCALLQDEGFAGRGIYQRPLAEVIKDALPAWSALLQVSRSRLKDMACIDACPGGAHCGGGCLARAYISSGDLAAKEDRCGLRKSVYDWKAKGDGCTD
jgi:radical SAM protein with 4Fe4S-binding SPASM domain